MLLALGFSTDDSEIEHIPCPPPRQIQAKGRKMAVMVTKLTDADSDIIMMLINIVAFRFITYKDLSPTSVAIVCPIVLWGKDAEGI